VDPKADLSFSRWDGFRSQGGLTFRKYARRLWTQTRNAPRLSLILIARLSGEGL
jgi:hypothetical protein